MKAATIAEIRKELHERPTKELIDLCLRLAKFKKDSKELLTYLLYESADEASYIRSVQQEIDEAFDQINAKSYFFIKKSIRKILRQVKKYIRYSGKKQTEVELLLYFCRKLKNMSPSYRRSTVMVNLYEGQIRMIRKAMTKLHEDLQFDYEEELAELT
ncbi:MAG: hypothetical protein AAF960_03355 [Bacteroidota bacterium]